MVSQKSIVTLGEVKGLLHEDRDFLKQLVREAVQETLEAEIPRGDHMLQHIAELDAHNLIR